MKKILVVDDEPSMREMLGIMLRREGYEVVDAGSRGEAAAALARGMAEMVITDVKLPDGDGIELLRHIKSASPETVVIVMTAFGSIETAVAALKLGAYDYLVKPFDIEELKIVVRNALEKRRLEEENLLLKAEFRDKYRLEQMVGSSKVMQEVFKLVTAVASTSSTVLITGESGTGKELVAKAIHALSPRRDAPFVSINCAALPEGLLESELFGHVKGAFTDAYQSKKGLFELAHHGTVFLDEVSEMAASMQVKLLRALQERTIRRVGGGEEIEIDVRVIAATNVAIEAYVRQRRFREDLYYRLNVIPIHVPPLRERRDDIPLLAHHFLTRFNKQLGKTIAGFTDEALIKLKGHAWPGNVRELENIIERVVTLETEAVIGPARLPFSAVLERERGGMDVLGKGFDLDRYIQATEAGVVRRALDQTNGNRREACRLLGLSERSLRYLIQKYGLQTVSDEK